MSSLILSVFESYENVSSFFILDTSQCFLIISISLQQDIVELKNSILVIFWKCGNAIWRSTSCLV